MVSRRCGMSRVFGMKSLRDVAGVSHPWDVRAFRLSIGDCAARNSDGTRIPVERKRKARFDSDGSRRILLSNVRNTAERRLRAPRPANTPSFSTSSPTAPVSARAEPAPCRWTVRKCQKHARPTPRSRSPRTKPSMSDWIRAPGSQWWSIATMFRSSSPARSTN